MSNQHSPKNPYVIQRDSFRKTFAKSVLFGLLFALFTILVLFAFRFMEAGGTHGFHPNWLFHTASFPCIGLFAIMSASLFATKTTSCRFTFALIGMAIATLACYIGFHTLILSGRKYWSGVSSFQAIAVLLVTPWSFAILLLGIHKLTPRSPEYLADFGPDVN